MERRTWIIGAVVAGVLVSGCSGDSDSKGPSGTTPTMTSSPASSTTPGTQSPNGEGATKAAPRLEPGQTGPATKELTSFNALMRTVATTDVSEQEQKARDSCTAMFGTPEQISAVVGTPVVQTASGPSDTTKAPADGGSSAGKWSLFCLWVDSTKPDVGTTIRLENHTLTPQQIAADVDEKAKEGWGVMCMAAPSQWTAKPPQGNLFYPADKNAKWPDAWAGQKDQNGVTIGCRANQRSAAQYGNTSKARGQAIDARAMKLRDTGLANLAK